MKIEYKDDQLVITGGYLPQIVADAVLKCAREQNKEIIALREACSWLEEKLRQTILEK